MSNMLTKDHENERDKNVPPIQAGRMKWDKNVLPIVDTYMDRRGFLTPPEGLSDATAQK